MSKGPQGQRRPADASGKANRREAPEDSQKRSSREMEISKQVREQVDNNYQAFLSMLPNIIAQHRNKYALMRDGQVIGYYSTLEDAYMTANKFYPNEPYSVQKVTTFRLI
jgi:Family of unknown function (DUF5678)